MSAPYPNSVKQAFTAAGFEKPTPIQSQSWPIANTGRDIISVARTGSGKTCGFLMPVFMKIQNRLKTRTHPLVLAPTRELAMQIQAEALKFGRPQGIRSVVLYGGAPKRRQIGELERGLVHMVVATPGRLNDLLDMRKTSVNLVEALVLDEADRMLDMGFEPQIDAILSKMPVQKRMMERPVPSSVQRLNVGKSGQLVANEDVEQIIKVVEPSAKTIVFLWNDGMACDSLHGDKDQWQRTRVLAAFKTARGLDVKDITHVINYDFPNGKGKVGIEDYVHRIGRTGRAGRKGTAYTLFTYESKKNAFALIQLLKNAKQNVPDELAKFGVSGRRGGGGRFGGRGRGGRYGGRGRGGRYGGRGRGGGRFGGRGRGGNRW
eukprot:GSMAST32.ASY1.ANO1.2106.1 assembled CDS